MNCLPALLALFSPVLVGLLVWLITGDFFSFIGAVVLTEMVLCSMVSRGRGDPG